MVIRYVRGLGLLNPSNNENTTRQNSVPKCILNNKDAIPYYTTEQATKLTLISATTGITKDTLIRIAIKYGGKVTKDNRLLFIDYQQGLCFCEDVNAAYYLISKLIYG